MRLSPKEGDVNLRGHTLVVPGVGGMTHLGHLCTDAIVATFELHRVAMVHSLHVLPVVMASAWEATPQAKDHLSLTTAAELYQSATKPLLSVLQLRSPIIEGRRQAFAEELWCWACSEGVAELLILGSCSSHVKGDADLVAATDLRYVCINSLDRHAMVKGLGAEVLPLGHNLEDSSTADHDGDIAAVQQLLRGSGIARSILLIASERAQKGTAAEGNREPSSAANTPGVLCLMGMTAETLNWHSMTQLARVACKCIEIKSALAATEFRSPPSWQFQMELAASPQQLWG